MRWLLVSIEKVTNKNLGKKGYEDDRRSMKRGIIIINVEIGLGWMLCF
jgi:hypothetical protein